jgi:GWxTD domain-containing protein
MRTSAGLIQKHLTAGLFVCVGMLTLMASSTRSVSAGTFQQSTAALVDSAGARLERGDLDEARRLYQQVLDAEGDHPGALIGMGRVFLADRAGAERALEFLRRATAADPTNVGAHYYRALAHLRLADSDLGRDNANFALRELEMVLTLDPSHSDARYQLGQLLQNVFGEGEAAVDAFRTQVAANPGHLDARFELVKALMDIGEWVEAVGESEALLARDDDYLGAYPYLAAAQWKREEPGESMAVFERYFERIDAQEMGLYMDLGLVLSSDEVRGLDQLPAQGLRAYWARYWRTRDPDPQTDVNERLLEHYIRVAYARIQFGQGTWPWDDRGDFYVRYGEPTYRSARGQPVAWGMVEDDPEFTRKKREHQESIGMPSQLAQPSQFDAPAFDPPPGVEKHLVVTIADSIWMENQFPPPGGERLSIMEIWEQASDMADRRSYGASSAATAERWVYVDRGIDLSFEDYTHRGDYGVTGDRSRMVVEQMEKIIPTISEEEEKIDLIDPMDSVTTFRGTDGKTAVEYAFALLPDEFGSFRSVTGTYATLDVEVGLYTESWEPVADTGPQRRRLQTIPQVSIRGIPLFVDATRIEVAPGTYRLTTLLLDPVSGKRATAEEMFELPDYSGSELMVSGILPAASVREVGPGREGRFIRNGLEVLPLPGRALQLDQPLFIYYEIYNLTKDPIGATEYEISYSVAEAPEERALTTRLFQGVQRLFGAGRRRAVLTSAVPRSGIFNDETAWLELDLSQLPADTYIVELTVTDKLTGAVAQGALLFRTLPAPD